MSITFHNLIKPSNKITQCSYLSVVHTHNYNTAKYMVTLYHYHFPVCIIGSFCLTYMGALINTKICCMYLHMWYQTLGEHRQVRDMYHLEYNNTVSCIIIHPNHLLTHSAIPKKWMDRVLVYLKERKGEIKRNEVWTGTDGHFSAVTTLLGGFPRNK